MESTEVIACLSNDGTDTALAVETELLRLGYASVTIKIYLRTVNRFCEWISSPERGVIKTLDEEIRDYLDRHLPVCDCKPRCPTRNSSHAALGHLQRLVGSNLNTRFQQHRNNPSPAHKEIISFDKYLNQVCGLAESTRLSRRRFVGNFLRDQCGDGPINTEKFTPLNLMRYVSSHSRGYTPGTVSVMATSIRSYIKYLQFRGDVDNHLIHVIPSPPMWRLADYPTVMSDEQVEVLIASFDDTSPSGERDRAMALCMLHMGLRASEVANLALEDIDWQRSTLKLCQGKSRAGRILPLMNSCGKAIARYLKSGRPSTDSRQVFVRHTVPVGSIMSSENVRGAMRRAYNRAGFPSSWTGTHILRHTAATRMLNNGASLKIVADVLGHQSIDTTIIYSKVHIKSLETVMQPWPEITL